MGDHLWPDDMVSDIAGGQATMVSHDQLSALGISTHSITAACRRRRLHRVHTAVYSLVPPRARPRFAAEHAALLACGPDAVLSHATAARIHGLELPGRADPTVHVTVGPHGRGRGRAGLTVHRSVDLPRHEITRRGGLRVTTVARALVDCVAGLKPLAVEALVDQALRRTSLAKLTEAADRHPTRPGVPLLRAILDPTRPSADAWSETERRLRRMLIRAGLPAPEANASLGRLRPDLLWREHRVIVEYDSDDFHFGPAGRRRTWERHEILQGQGFDVIHVTWDDVRHHRERILVRVAAALTRGGWVPD